jgi:UDP:flavonoid glycosyltransferase YjiC (YdhE family)
LGINLKTERPDPAQLRQAFEKVTGNAMYKKNVINLSQEFARYKPNELVAQYVANVLEPVKEIHNTKQKPVNNLAEVE